MSVIGRKRLMEHLGIRNARLISSSTSPGGSMTMTWYEINGANFLVTTYAANSEAFNIFIPVSRSLSPDTVLAKLDDYTKGTI